MNPQLRLVLVELPIREKISRKISEVLMKTCLVKLCDERWQGRLPRGRRLSVRSDLRRRKEKELGGAVRTHELLICTRRWVSGTEPSTP
jgi:hypothetical protein